VLKQRSEDKRWTFEVRRRRLWSRSFWVVYLQPRGGEDSLSCFENSLRTRQITLSSEWSAWHVDFDLENHHDNWLLERWSMVLGLNKTTRQLREIGVRRWSTSSKVESWSHRDCSGDAVGEGPSSLAASRGAITCIRSALTFDNTASGQPK